MKLMMFCVHDTASGVYDRPWCCRSVGEALRSFGDIAQDKSHPIGKHPEHFRLFKVGEFDDNSGKIKGIPAEHVVNAIDFIEEGVSSIAEGVGTALREVN